MKRTEQEQDGATKRPFISDELGQDLVEYGLLAAMIAVVAIAAVGTLATRFTRFCGSTLLTTFSHIIVLAAVGIGTATDLQWRRIPNVLTGATALIGLIAAAAGASQMSFWFACAGLGVGLCLMLPGHVLGATGAGDVKLVAAIGALVGPGAVTRVVLYTAIVGGMLALGVALRRGRLTATVAGAAHLASGSKVARQQIVAARDNRFPYAPAIAIGTLIALAV